MYKLVNGRVLDKKAETTFRKFFKSKYGKKATPMQIKRGVAAMNITQLPCEEIDEGWYIQGAVYFK